MSTFVVPCATSPPSIPSGSRSRRAYTLLHAEKHSARRRSPCAVSTGSRNDDGVYWKYRVAVTSASVSSPRREHLRVCCEPVEDSVVDDPGR